jgi:nitroimidazol reductase NimA-like FMN-containing flavoprotein (pyridoxamine 5'-phosphate oxidase superfamily)
LGRGRSEETFMEQPAPDMVLEELSLTECLALLDSHQVGRVAVVVDGRPMILPVNYRTDDGTVVFRTDAGTKERGTPLSQVAFEIDDIDDASHVGWSVVVQGVGRDITDAIDARSEELRVLPVTPWAPGDKVYWIKIVPKLISGRRLRRRHQTDSAG